MVHLRRRGRLHAFGAYNLSASNVQTSNSATTLTNNFTFTPTQSTSTILQLAQFQGNTCMNTYNGVNGITAFSIQSHFMGADQVGWCMSYYAPGSSSSYTLGQTWVPNNCFESMYGWGIELLPACEPQLVASSQSTGASTTTALSISVSNVTGTDAMLVLRINQGIAASISSVS